jgi:hypothetical protein
MNCDHNYNLIRTNHMLWNTDAYSNGDAAQFLSASADQLDTHNVLYTVMANAIIVTCDTLRGCSTVLFRRCALKIGGIEMSLISNTEYRNPCPSC